MAKTKQHSIANMQENSVLGLVDNHLTLIVRVFCSKITISTVPGLKYDAQEEAP